VLRSFRLGNHRSFRDEQELSLLPAYDKSRRAIPVAAIYGANASGKSNLLDGLRFVANAVTGSFADWKPGTGVPRKPFRLDPAASAQPSLFVVELMLDGVRYTYGFTVDDDAVLEEWLYSYPEKRRRAVFERKGEEIKLGSTLPSPRGKEEFLEDVTRQNSLLLSVAALVNMESALPVYTWFQESVRFRAEPGRRRSDEQEVAKFIWDSPVRSEALTRLLRIADLGITGLHVNREYMAFREGVERELDNIDSRIEAKTEHITQVIDSLNAAELTVTISALFDGSYLQFAHGDRGVLFGIEDESEGTRGWLRLLPDALLSLERGGMLVVDEIDASLHPRLTASLIELFHDQDTNANGAQLVFTTHDASLLSPVLGEDVLKRDEVWFVTKRRDGSTELYPLSDFHPRKGENTERRYLGGSYGAVPSVLGEDLVDAVRAAGLVREADG
jgi:hypothetical protein